MKTRPPTTNRYLKERRKELDRRRKRGKPPKGPAQPKSYRTRHPRTRNLPGKPRFRGGR